MVLMIIMTKNDINSNNKFQQFMFKRNTYMTADILVFLSD